jgi:signal transduction histidine kinase
MLRNDQGAAQAAPLSDHELAGYLQMVIEFLPSGVSLVDGIGNVIAWNQRFKRLLDYPDELLMPGQARLEKLVRHNLERGDFGEDDPQQEAENLLARFRRREPYAIERTRPDGTSLEIRGQPLPGGGFVILCSNITERKQAEREARRFAAYLRAVLDNLPHGISVVDDQLGLVLYNEAFLKLLDLPKELAETGRYDELIRHNARRGEYGTGDPEALTEERLALMRRFEPHRFTRLRPGGTVLDIIGRPLSIEGRTAGFVSAFIDVTHHKQAEEEIRRLNAGLEQRVASRTAELEAANRQLAAFTSSVSHDLRAPLRAIGGYLGMLREDLPPPLTETSRALFARIDSALGRMTDIIDDLLALSRVGQGALQTTAVDLSRLAREVAAEIAEAEPDCRADWRIADDVEACADASLMRFALDNLMRNAWKYSGKAEQPRIEFGSRVENGERIYYVRDNGVGFDMAGAKGLFGPFVRLHDRREFEGTGLGLTIVDQVIRHHGGRVWAEAAPGKGATFSFTLPEKNPSPE